MLRVGLSGGIASGKTTISQLFSDLGIPVIDTDVISHALMQPGQPGFVATVKHFGKKFLKDDGSLNRAQLRQRVFAIPNERKWLEDMLHPLIRQHTKQAIEQLDDAAYCLVVVPLMFETGFDQLLDHIIVIDCSLAVQKSRLMARDQIDAELAERMIQSQMSNEQRIARGDFIIENKDNSNPLPQIKTIHRQLLNHSSART